MTGDFYDCFTASEVFRIGGRQAAGSGLRQQYHKLAQPIVRISTLAAKQLWLRRAIIQVLPSVLT